MLHLCCSAMRATGHRVSSLLLATCLLLAAPTRAAAPDLPVAGAAGHVQGARIRSLAARLGAADTAVIGRIEEVGLGRIRIQRQKLLLGQADAAFEIKRAPSNPAELEPGDVAILNLRGARSPYLLVDRPIELIKLETEAELELWDRSALALVGTAPADRVVLYESWLDGGSDAIASDALRALSERNLAGDVLPWGFFERRVATATDGERSAAVRSASAAAALFDPRGAAALLSRLPGGDEALPEVLRIALGRGAREAPEPARQAFLRSLAHPREDIRRTALRTEGPFREAPGVAAAIEQLARDDPSPELRALAHRISAARPRNR